MPTIHLIVGSMLGAAEDVADHMAQLLGEADLEARIHDPADLAILDGEKDQIWLICTSTHGAGEFPDNLAPFVGALKAERPALEALKYGVVALGSSSYDTFCQAGKEIDRLLQDLGAKRIGDRLEIDVSEAPIPEDSAEIWLENWIKQL